MMPVVDLFPREALLPPPIETEGLTVDRTSPNAVTPVEVGAVLISETRKVDGINRPSRLANLVLDILSGVTSGSEAISSPWLSTEHRAMLRAALCEKRGLRVSLPKFYEVEAWWDSARVDKDTVAYLEDFPQIHGLVPS